VPSAALVTLAGDFGVTAASARAALSRLARRGVVDQTRQGRRTSYALSPDAAQVLIRGSHRLVAFAGDAEDWDGQWTVVAFSMPEDRRDARHLLRSRLRWQGFAPLYDGMWVSPRAGAAEAAEIVEGLGVPAVTVLRAGEAVPAGPGTRLLLHAWDLDEIAAGYQEFLGQWSPIVQRLRRGDVGAGEALVVRTRIMDTYRRFPSLDPQLPMRLMPAGWPREQARALFTEVYDWLGPLAETRAVTGRRARLGPGCDDFPSHHDRLAARRAPVLTAEPDPADRPRLPIDPAVRPGVVGQSDQGRIVADISGGGRSAPR
jgi:phenylacetic acid degradation operon negative regulatory protein